MSTTGSTLPAQSLSPAAKQSHIMAPEPRPAAELPAIAPPSRPMEGARDGEKRGNIVRLTADLHGVTPQRWQSTVLGPAGRGAAPSSGVQSALKLVQHTAGCCGRGISPVWRHRFRNPRLNQARARISSVPFASLIVDQAPSGGKACNAQFCPMVRCPPRGGRNIRRLAATTASTCWIGGIAVVVIIGGIRPFGPPYINQMVDPARVEQHGQKV